MPVADFGFMIYLLVRKELSGMLGFSQLRSERRRIALRKLLGPFLLVDHSYGPWMLKFAIQLNK